jgi:hypothetical protein
VVRDDDRVSIDPGSIFEGRRSYVHEQLDDLKRGDGGCVDRLALSEGDVQPFLGAT